MTAVTFDGDEIEIAKMGRRLADNGKQPPDRETIALAEGVDGKQYVGLCDGQGVLVVATVEGSPPHVSLIGPLEFTAFDGFEAFDPDAMNPRDWPQKLIDA